MSVKAWLARKANMALWALKVKKPTICIVAGSIGAVASAVGACVQTARKLDDVIDKHNEDMAKIREARAKSESGELNLEKEGIDLKKATYGVYMRTFWRGLKVYILPAAGMAVSIGLIAHGTHVMGNRHAMLLAAHAALEDRFTKYRKRVKGLIGNEREEALFHGSEKRIIDEVDPKTGEVKPAERDVIVNRGDNLGDYSFIYDIANAPTTWSNRPGQNLLFLTGMQCTLNDRLTQKGYVSLNQALESLGMDPVREGQFVGWIYNKGTDLDRPVINLGIIAGANDTDDPGYFAGGSPDYILNFNCNANLEAYFAKKQTLKCRTRSKVFVRRKKGVA